MVVAVLFPVSDSVFGSLPDAVAKSVCAVVGATGALRLAASLLLPEARERSLESGASSRFALPAAPVVAGVGSSVDVSVTGLALDSP